MVSFWEKIKKNLLIINFSGEDKIKGKSLKVKDYPLILLAFLGIALMVFSSFFSSFSREEKEGDKEEAIPAVFQKEVNREKEMEKALEEMLNQMEGLSGVSVLINYQSSSRQVYAFDYEESYRETEEQDGGGGTRDSRETTYRDQVILRRGEQGQEEPLLIKEVHPEVTGVLIVARGVENPNLKSLVVEALSSILDLPPHKVVVLPRG